MHSLCAYAMANLLMSQIERVLVEDDAYVLKQLSLVLSFQTMEENRNNYL